MLKEAWTRRLGLAILLTPLSWLFCILVSLRRLYQSKLAPNPPLNVPVVVVGNISVGGTGKTPLVAAIALWLKQQGYNPGIVSRGYGGKSSKYPLLVAVDSLPSVVGDEPLLLAKEFPVVVDPNRYRAANFLLENTNCDLILSDDGLQHYRLPRDIEIAVVDGKNKFGNGRCLPAGPLRESVRRLKQVDFVLTNIGGHHISDRQKSSRTCSLENSAGFYVKPIQLRHLSSGKVCPIEVDAEFVFRIKNWSLGRNIYAVAGIGSPQGFAGTLRSVGLDPQLNSYPDHHDFSGKEFVFKNDWPVIITAKDEVKCLGLINDKIWVLDVRAVPDQFFLEKILKKLCGLNSSGS